MTDDGLQAPPPAVGDSQAAKRAAAARAVEMVRDGMVLGLGTGSTAAIFVALLAERMDREGLRLMGVPTSIATGAQASGLGIALTSLETVPELDMTVDGADEVDPALRLIKGGGGALLREKIVAAASARMVVIADRSKEVDTLGAFPLPVEIVRFGAEATLARVAAVLERQDVDAREITRRRDERGLFVTDEGHEILDLNLDRIGDPEALDRALLDIPGVVETGLFLDIASATVIGHTDGTVTERTRPA